MDQLTTPPVNRLLPAKGQLLNGFCIFVAKWLSVYVSMYLRLLARQSGLKMGETCVFNLFTVDSYSTCLRPSFVMPFLRLADDHRARYGASTQEEAASVRHRN